jgi:hypothetical protein
LLDRVLAGDSPLTTRFEPVSGGVDDPDPFDLAAAEQESEEGTGSSEAVGDSAATESESGDEGDRSGEGAPAAVPTADDDGAAGAPAVGAAFRWTELLDPGQVRLEGMLTPRVVGRVREAVDSARRRLGADPALYGPSLLAHCRDYRTLVSLRYVEKLARRAGVRSEITPVLSLPLGSSDITLLEASLMYQLILRGETYRFFADALVPLPAVEIGEAASAVGGDGIDALPSVGLVTEIRTAAGTLVYRLDRDAVPVHDEGLSAEVAAMLGAVVNHGTGGRARGRVRPTSSTPERAGELADLGIAMPLFGKTGTTNSYRNSAFVGFVPGIAAGGDRLTVRDGLVVAAYVGYDDNREMRSGSIRLAGASGSLPVWLEAAAGAVRGSGVGDSLDLADLAFSGADVAPVRWPDAMVPVRVDLTSGLPFQRDPEDLEGAGESGPSEGSTILYRRREPRAFAPLAPSERSR